MAWQRTPTFGSTAPRKSSSEVCDVKVCFQGPENRARLSWSDWVPRWHEECWVMNKELSDADAGDGCHIPGHQIRLLGLSRLDPDEQNCPVSLLSLCLYLRSWHHDRWEAVCLQCGLSTTYFWLNKLKCCPFGKNTPLVVWIYVGFFFYCSIIAFQHCVTFHCTTKWTSYMYIYTCFLLHLPHQPTPSQPSGPSQSTKLHALCIQQLPTSSLFTQGSVYMSIQISQFIPPNTPSPAVPTYPVSTSASLFLPWT